MEDLIQVGRQALFSAFAEELCPIAKKSKRYGGQYGAN